MCYTHLVIGFAIGTLLDSSKMTDTEEKALRLPHGQSRGTTHEEFLGFCLFFLTPFPQSRPQLGLRHNI